MPTINLGPADKLAIPDVPTDITDIASALDPAAPMLVLLLTGQSDEVGVSIVGRSCTHQGCSILTGGAWGTSEFPLFNPQTQVITCPCHGSQFNLTDGSVVRGPAATPLPVYLSRIVGGELLVDY